MHPALCASLPDASGEVRSQPSTRRYRARFCICLALDADACTEVRSQPCTRSLRLPVLYLCVVASRFR